MINLFKLFIAKKKRHGSIVIENNFLFTHMIEKKYHILSVDDDSRLRQLLADYLTSHGYYIHTVGSVDSARQLMQLFVFDLIILDVMMPKESGMDFLISLKQNTDHYCDIPVLMLTAKGESDNRIEGLENGAQDYLPKPFEPKELLLRAANLLERSQKRNQREYNVHFGDFYFDNNAQALYCNDKFIFLNEAEKKLLNFFIENPNIAHTRERLTEVLGAVNERTADVTVSRLRQKIENNSRCAQYLQTVRGTGYAFITF